MTTITTEKIEELRELAKKATPGPWLYRTDPGNPTGFQHCVKLSGEFGMWICDCLDNADRVTEGGTAGERNAAFIAAANPATMLALLDLAQRAMVPQPQGQALPELPKPDFTMVAAWIESGDTPSTNRKSLMLLTDVPVFKEETVRAYASQPALPAGPVPEEKQETGLPAFVVDAIRNTSAAKEKCKARLVWSGLSFRTESCKTKRPLIDAGGNSDGTCDDYVCPDCNQLVRFYHGD